MSKFILAVYKRLQKEQSERPEPPEAVGYPEKLKLSQIQVLPHVFQVRDLPDGEDVDKYFLEAVEKRLRSTGELDALTIWWGGEGFYLVDGHHRYRAYEKVYGPDTEVAVRCLPSSETNPRGRATEENSKLKLPLRREELSNIAWQDVCIFSDLSARELESLTVRKKSQLSTMQNVRDELLSNGRKLNEISGWSWGKALGIYRGVEASLDDSYDDDKLAFEFKDRLIKEFSDKLSTNPEAFAKAIRLYNSQLPLRLVDSEDWGIVVETINQLVEAPELDQDYQALAEKIWAYHNEADE
ncbi:MAG: hypothetical protein CL557_01975 [Alphaproteobacteria bacterium]|mgnify:FL=1|nr:hypothetical protein [Alphaproteobacteria bacterium]|tara:strand:- start:1156 stop:2049 length:894 start_codon:yes stop_codon:yes gene_type:complete